MKHPRGMIAVLIVLASVSIVAASTDWLLSAQKNDFWVDAQDGWWSDVLILSDGSGPSDVLSRLAPDALNWAHYELPSFLAEQGTRRIASAGIEYQESEELTPEDITDWEFASSLAYNVYDQPIYYGDWGGSYFMDPHSPPWANAVLEGIEERLATADGVSQDNIGVPPFIKGQGVFSELEKTEFRTFLEDSLGSDRLLFLGIDASSLDIAQYIRDHNYVNGNPNALLDPIFRSFVLYQYVSNLQIWQGMLDETGIAEMDNKIIHGNQYGVWSPGDSNPYSVLLSQLHQVVEIEYVSHLNSLPPNHHESLIAKIGLASGKHEKPVWIRGIVYDWQQGEAVLRTNHLRLITASAYANGALRTFEYSQGTPNGTVDLSAEATESLLQYYDWLDDCRFLFERQASTANVALVYSIPTMMWRFFPATQHWNSQQVASLSGIAHVLDLEHIPYDAVVFGHPAVWSDEDLAKRLEQYDVLILPDVDCLSDEQIGILEAFVAEGGRLLCTGELGINNENLEPRISWRIALLQAHPDVQVLSGTPGRDFFQNEVLNGLQADEQRQSIESAVSTLLANDTILETTAPESILINQYRTDEGLATVHFLNQNYDFDSDVIVPSGSFELRLRIPEDIAFVSDNNVHLFGDAGTIRVLPSEIQEGWLVVMISSVETHAILCLGDLAQAVDGVAAYCQASLDRNPWAANDAGIAAQIEQLQALQSTEDWVSILTICAELEDQIASSKPNVLFDFSHYQEVALDEEAARTIDSEHPEWYVLEGLASYVTATLDSGPLTDTELQNTSVLIIAPHRMAFSSSEVPVIEQFVRDGGGVLFIGNGGVPSSYEIVAAPFGLRMHPYSTLVAEDHLWDEVSFDASDFIEHPITRGLANIQLNYAAPMTVDSQWQIVASTASEVWQDGGDLVGPFPVVAYRTLGEGRMAAVCDNAPFGDRNNTSLLYNLIRWLAGG
jgi:hypothetical protein